MRSDAIILTYPGLPVKRHVCLTREGAVANRHSRRRLPPRSVFSGVDGPEKMLPQRPDYSTGGVAVLAARFLTGLSLGARSWTALNANSSLW